MTFAVLILWLKLTQPLFQTGDLVMVRGEMPLLWWVVRPGPVTVLSTEVDPPERPRELIPPNGIPAFHPRLRGKEVITRCVCQGHLKKVHPWILLIDKSPKIATR